MILGITIIISNVMQFLLFLQFNINVKESIKRSRENFLTINFFSNWKMQRERYLMDEDYYNIDNVNFIFKFSLSKVFLY